MTSTAPVRKTRYIVALATCAVVVIVAVALVIVLSENVVYYRTVSEAVRERTELGTDRFRIAGAVVPGSIHETSKGVRFKVTDGTRTVRVVHDGDPPDLFKAKAPVLCEGRWGRALTFDSDRILIKHGAEYQAPKVDTEKAPKAAPGPGREI